MFISSKGVVFERTDYKKRTRVRVMNEHMTFKTYRFDYIEGAVFNSPYLSWENLNYCGGWHYDEDYLYTAVQKGKKVCAGLKFGSEKDLNDYVDTIDKEKYYYVDKSWEYIGWDNKIHRWNLMDISRKGKLSDYYNFDELNKYYSSLGFPLDWIDFDFFNDLFNSEIIDLINGSKDFSYSFAGKFIEEDIITGLLLGYPIESTVSYIQEC